MERPWDSARGGRGVKPALPLRSRQARLAKIKESSLPFAADRRKEVYMFNLTQEKKNVLPENKKNDKAKGLNKISKNIRMWAKEMIRPDYFWLLLFLFILTQPVITDLISHFFMEYFFSHFPSEGFNLGAILILIIFFSGVLYYAKIKLWKTRYIVKNTAFLIASFVLVIFYISRRCCSDLYDFYPLSKDCKPWLKMMDLPMILFLITIIILIINKILRRNNDEDTYDFIKADVPLKKLDDDQFKREAVFKSLLSTISSNSISNEKSIAIGLVNRWGEGKTSFLQILSREIEDKKDTIVVSFNPWLSSQPDNLTSDFFNTLDEHLSQFIYTGRLFRQYAQRLSRIDTGYNPLLYLPRRWLGHRSNQEYFNRINGLIRKLDKRIFILIDDMDRLHPKEVFELLRMIRNSASFPHMIFVVPFEKEYVTKALEENRIHNEEDYLKKIFDVEITLPPIPKKYIQGLLEDRFEEMLKLIFTDDKEELEEEKEWLFNQFKQCIGKDTEEKSELTDQSKRVKKEDPKEKDKKSDRFISLKRKEKDERYVSIQKIIFDQIKNGRDVNRFLNSLSMVLKDNHLRIYLPDILILELIKMIDIREYRYIYEIYPEIDFSKATLLASNLLGKSTSGIGKNESKELDEAPDSEASSNIEILRKILFQKPTKEDYNYENAFSHPINKDNYLEYRVEGVSLKELLELMKDSDTNELYDFLEKKEKEFLVLDRLETITKLSFNHPYMEELIKITLFFMDNTERDYYGYLKILRNWTMGMLREIIKSEEDVKRFSRIIKEEKYHDFHRITELIKDLIFLIEENIPPGLSTEEEIRRGKLLSELMQINQGYLDDSIKNKLKYDEIENIFWKCIERYDIDRDPIFTENAIEIFKDYISKNPIEYLSRFIRQDIPTSFQSWNRRNLHHIPAYYYEQIFPPQKASFCDWLKKVEHQIKCLALISDIRQFMKIYKAKKANSKENIVVILFNVLDSSPADLKLKYEGHKKVIQECLPPKYGKK